MNTLNSILAKYNLKNNFFKILTYPIYSIVTNTIVLALSMKNIFSKLFLKNELRMFSEDKAINNFWYDTMALNLQKHGRLGYSKTITEKEYLVGRWFHVSKFSLYPYWRSSVLTVLLSWMFIPISFYVLFPSVSVNWFFLITFLTLIGSTYFSQLELQNYNIMGWALYPLLFCSIENNNLIALAIVVCLMFLTSFTAYFVSFGYFFIAILLGSITLKDFLFVQLFSIPLVIYRVYPLYVKRELMTHLMMVGNTIGLFKATEAKYTRNIRNTKAVILSGFKFSFLLVFLLVVDFRNESYYLLVTLGYLIINNFIARFADKQTIDMIVLVTSFYYLIKSESLIELTLYWILISNPLPKFNFINDNDNFLKLKTLDPYDSGSLNKKIVSFLAKIKSDKVYLSFDDPLNKHENLFAEQRMLVEPFHYHANNSNILLLPNLWSVTDENIESENLWTRDPEGIIKLMENKSFDFLIYHTTEGESIPSKLLNNFEVLDSLNWKEHLPETFSSRKIISWHLLSKKNINSKKSK
jgi:hypothetical protein